MGCRKHKGGPGRTATIVGPAEGLFGAPTEKTKTWHVAIATCISCFDADIDPENHMNPYSVVTASSYLYITYCCVFQGMWMKRLLILIVDVFMHESFEDHWSPN
jgi:hypothetical protein